MLKPNINYIVFINSCSYDFLEIWEPSPTNQSAPDKRRLCGDWSSRLKLLRHVSRGPRLQLRFESDYSHHYTGFKATLTMENGKYIETSSQNILLSHVLRNLEIKLLRFGCFKYHNFFLIYFFYLQHLRTQPCPLNEFLY